MNAVLPLAEKMLKQYGEFYPYGGYIKEDGALVEVGTQDPDSDHPRSKDLIYLLRSSLREIASSTHCRAVAIVVDVTVIPPTTDRKSDAIQVCLEHVDGYSAEVFFPYQIVAGDIVYGKTFAQAGKHEIF